MKPSERRALMEEKNRMREEASSASQTENLSSNESQFPEDLSDCDVKANHTLKNKNGKTILDDDVESMRKEGFFQSHVKLITFIITVSLLFMLIGPFSVIRIVEMVEESRHFRDGETLTVEQIKIIANNKPMITWSDFDGYSYEDQSTKTTTVREYYVKEDGYSLVVRGPKSDTKFPDNVHLMYSDDNGTTFIDLRTEDIKGFLAVINASDKAEELRPMTLEDLEGMVGISSNFAWANFNSFKYEATQRVEMETVYYIRIYKVAGTNLSVVLEGKKISGYPETVKLVNNVTLEERDLKRENVSDFINEQKGKE